MPYEIAFFHFISSDFVLAVAITNQSWGQTRHYITDFVSPDQWFKCIECHDDYDYTESYIKSVSS